MGASVINVPITIKDRMVGFVMNARIWLFADHTYNPSYWLILKREGFSGNLNFNSVELSYELIQFDRDALAEIYKIHHGESPNDRIGNQLLLEIEHLVLSGRVKVFVLEMDLLTRVGDPLDPLMNESQGFYDSGTPVVATRNKLAEELGLVIGTRWLGKDSADQLHWDRSVIMREMVERYDEGVAVVDTVIDVIVGLWDIGVFAVKLVGSIVEFQFELVGKAVTGDFAGVKDQLVQLGIDTVNSVEDAIAKANQGYDILQRLNKDPQTQTLIYDFFDSLYQSMHYRDTRTLGIRIISAVGIEVLIALATAGAGNIARVAASSTAKTVKVARSAATATRNIGPFTAKSIDLMGDLAALLKSNTKILDEDLDLPPVEPIKIPESGRLGVTEEVSQTGGAAARNGVYTPQLTTRTNAELGIGGTRTPDQSKEILAKAGIDAPLDEYNFIALDDDSFTNIVVNQTGRDAYASYGIIPPGAKDVSFGKHIQSNGKIPIYVRDEVFESDESIVQILGHEIYEIEELRYVAQAPISVKQYNNLVGDGIYGNLHYNAVLEGDDLLRAYRKSEGL